MLSAWKMNKKKEEEKNAILFSGIRIQNESQSSCGRANKKYLLSWAGSAKEALPLTICTRRGFSLTLGAHHRAIHSLCTILLKLVSQEGAPLRDGWPLAPCDPAPHCPSRPTHRRGRTPTPLRRSARTSRRLPTLQSQALHLYLFCSDWVICPGKLK